MLDILNGSLVFPLVNIGGATEHIGSSVARKKLDCFVEILNGVVIFAHRAICLCSVHEGNGGSGIEGNCLIEIFDSVAGLAIPQMGRATAEVEVGVFRIEVDGTVELLECTLVIPCDRVECGGPGELAAFIHPGLNFHSSASERCQSGRRTTGRDHRLR